MNNYILAGTPCKRCLDGQAFWQWEPISKIYTQPPFKTIRVLKCFQCSHRMEYEKENK